MTARKTSASLLLRAAVATSAALTLACSDGEVTALDDARPLLDFTGPGDIRPGDGQLEQEQFELCKVGMGATFTVDVINNKTDGTREVLSYDVSVSDGQCLLVWESGGPGVDTVTVTEQVPAGYAASWELQQLSGGATTVTNGSGNSTSGYVNGLNSGGTPTNAGALALFTNVPLPPPGEGCTPGFWRNPKRFDYWTTYFPSDAFTAPGFENAFPGMTLGDVVGLGGGGLNALGRHSVAALLNALSPDVDYAYSATAVVSMFNDAYNGVTDVETTKDAFVLENEYLSPICQ